MSERLTITEPGEYSLTKEQYEADPVEGGSLRASIAWVLANQTPAHALYAMQNRRAEKRSFDIGSAAHALLLSKGAEIEVIDAENYKTKGAQIARDEAYKQGKTPLLAAEMVQVKDMVSAVRRQLRDLVDYGTLLTEPFQHNEAERVIVWREDNGVWCRAALDGLSVDGDELSEFKTEGQLADPKAWQWKSRKMGYIFRLCFYARGLSKLNMAHSPSARFFVAETEPPNCMAMIRVDDELMMKEAERVARVIKLFGQCQRQDRWPGYSLDGYDIGLTERERKQEEMQSAFGGGHVDSETIAANL